jgi:hypothetical protein
MHIEYEEIIRTKVPALQGRDAKNNKLILETLALHGPLIKYDIFKVLKSKGIKHYPTISRRVDDLKKRGYLDIAGKRLIIVGKRREESPTYALTWRGFIASLVIETVIEDIPRVLKNNPLLKFDLPYEAPKEMIINVLEELFTPREMRIIASTLLIGFLRALPRNIESIRQENYLAYLVPGFKEMPEIMEKFEEKDLSKLLQIPGLLELALNLVKTYEEQLSEALKGIRVIKRELAKYIRTRKAHVVSV